MRGTGEAVELSGEFRRLALQVIGEALLSLSPEECDRVFPHLYLPIMEEGNRRSLEPWRAYLLTPDWFRHRRRVRLLNDYICGLLRARWARRQAGEKSVRWCSLSDLSGASLTRPRRRSLGRTLWTASWRVWTSGARTRSGSCVTR